MPEPKGPFIEGLLKTVTSDKFSESGGDRLTGAMISSNGDVSIFQKLAPQFGFKVTVLKREGETYTTDPRPDDHTGEERTHTGTVPEGNSYIRVSSTNPAKRDAGDLWRAVNAEKASQQNSSNPPKV